MGKAETPEADFVEAGAAAMVVCDTAEEGAADATGEKDAQTSEVPAMDASAGAAGEEQAAAQPAPKTGTAAALPKAWLLKAQARSGMKGMPKGPWSFSKVRDGPPAAQEQAAVP